jgi:mono/diheme cytochrome c family protein
MQNRPPFRALRLAQALVVALGLTSPGCAEERCPPAPSATAAAPVASASVAVAATAPASRKAALAFGGQGRAARELDLAALLAAIPSETVVQYDPYYNREKRYRALPFARVLERGFEGVADLARQEFVLRALDGYTVPMRGAKAFEPGAYLAYEDLDAPGWEPIGQQRANPGPLYLVWAGKEQTVLETHPRPYQLASIDLARFEDVFPKTVPKGVAEGDPAWRGFAIFRDQCVHCHAINRQGGRVGPELNVPRSIVEYRPVDQIKAYIQNPLAFRYSTMPAHSSFGDAELDGLVAYFSAMKDRKQDDEKSQKSP